MMAAGGGVVIAVAVAADICGNAAGTARAEVNGSIGGVLVEPERLRAAPDISVPTVSVPALAIVPVPVSVPPLAIVPVLVRLKLPNWPGTPGLEPPTEPEVRVIDPVDTIGPPSIGIGAMSDPRNVPSSATLDPYKPIGPSAPRCPDTTMLDPSGTGPNCMLPARKSASAMLPVDRTIPAVSILPVGPTTMPLGLTRKTWPLAVIRPRICDGSVATTRLRVASGLQHSPIIKDGAPACSSGYRRPTQRACA